MGGHSGGGGDCEAFGPMDTSKGLLAFAGQQGRKKRVRSQAGSEGRQRGGMTSSHGCLSCFPFLIPLEAFAVK